MLSESLIYFNKNNLANFYIRKLQRIFPSCRFFENTRKKLLLNLVVALVLVFYSKGCIGGFNLTSSPPCWWTVNKRSLISSLCLSTSISSFHHRYLCLPRLHENHLLDILSKLLKSVSTRGELELTVQTLENRKLCFYTTKLGVEFSFLCEARPAKFLFVCKIVAVWHGSLGNQGP